MDKTHFLEILKHYASTSVDQAQQVASLKAEYPYSQVLHALAARVGKDHGFQYQQRDLQMAAVYAADRALLKELVTLQPQEPVQQLVSQHVDAHAQAVATVDSVDVADIVMDDLERLTKLKDAFEDLFMDYPRSGEEQIHEMEVKAREDEAQGDPTPGGSEEAPAETVPAPRRESGAKSKKERIIEMAKAVAGATPEQPISSKKKPVDKDGNPVDSLIAEIQSSKEEILPENERQKQQIEIINQFIRVQPSISNPRERIPSAAGDLMPIKSGEFGDNIVSETLVEILVKQGKKDKAIEVLKKLIWKYPQKKAYFASQIEDLKK